MFAQGSWLAIGWHILRTPIGPETMPVTLRSHFSKN